MSEQQLKRFEEKKVNVSITTDGKFKLDAIMRERQKLDPLRITQIRMLQILIDDEYERLGLDKKEGK